MRVAVIGSGLTGLACVKGLLERGVQVDVLDVGEELDAERQRLVADLQARPVSAWDRASVARIKENPTLAGARGVPGRRLFGADFVFATERDHSPMDVVGTPIAPTFAKGGFSTVWGASILPVAQSDIADWPIRRSALEPYYRKLLRTMPLSAEPVSDDDEFPLFAEDVDPIPMPAQCAELITRLRERGARLAKQGLRFERARLAVRNTNSPAGLGCVSCGLCLYGCVPNAIYSTVSEIDQLKRRGDIDYLEGLAVQVVEEGRDGVTVRWMDRRGQAGDRTYGAVFLALGAINTTRLLIRSLQLFDRTATLFDSQKFILPLLTFRSSALALDQNKPILPGVFLDLYDPELDPHWIHAQIYPTSTPMLSRLHLDPEDTRDLRLRVLAPILRRLMVAWVGVHSDHSGRLALKLDPQTQRLEVKAIRRSETVRHVRRVASRYFKLGLQFGVLFAPLAKVIAAPGAGYHFGGSFPMRAAPQDRMESDVWGRVAGQRRIFAVDSTVLPSIPATTVTLTAMANAWRIGAGAPLPTAIQ